MDTHKKLYRSSTNRVLAGVCGGLGEYLNTDPTVLRLLWTLITVLTGIFPGILIYIIAVFIIPEKNQHHDQENKTSTETNKKETNSRDTTSST